MPNSNQLNQQFHIQRIYAKQSSFELKNAPGIFYATGVPEHKMELNIKQNKLKGEHLYEVTLDISVTTILKKSAETEKSSKEAAQKTGQSQNKPVEIYTVNVKQAGIFHIQGFEKETQKQILSAYCPEILYPYARHTISELIVMSSLPPVTLVPMSFDSLYREQQAQQKSEVKNRDEILH